MREVAIIYPANTFKLVSDMPHLGPLYIISFLKEKGIEARFYDFTFENNWKKKIHEIIDSNPRVIGFSSTVSNFSNTIYIANYVKSFDKNIIIIVGGPYPTCAPEKYLLNPAFDAVIIGEGERSFYKYLEVGNKGTGLMIRKNGQTFVTEPTPKIENLDDLPFPDLTQVDLNKYYYIFKKGNPLSSIISSRGCPYNCTFCFHEVHGHIWRARSPKNVIKEIKWQVNELGVGELAFADDNLTLDQVRAEKIFDLMSQEKLDICFSAPNGVRVDCVNKSMLSKMKKAGFWIIVLAPETGDSFVIKKIRKGFTLKETEIVANWCKELGFFLVLYFIMGFPFETKEMVQNSLQFIERIKPDIFNLNRFYPLPKTPIVDEFNLNCVEGHVFSTFRMNDTFEKLYNAINFHFFSNPANLHNIIKKVGGYRFLYSIFKLSKVSLKNRIKNYNYALRNEKSAKVSDLQIS